MLNDTLTLVANQARYATADNVKERVGRELTAREQVALDKAASEFAEAYIAKVMPTGQRPQQEERFAMVLIFNNVYNNLPKGLRKIEELSNLDLEVVAGAMIDGLMRASLSVHTDFSPVARPGIYNQVWLTNGEVDGKGFTRAALINFVDKMRNAHPTEQRKTHEEDSLYNKTERFLEDVVNQGANLNTVQNMYYNALHRDLEVNGAYEWLTEAQVAHITSLLMEALEETHLQANAKPLAYA